MQATDEASSAKAQQSSLRSLLMARYFEAVSESASVVSLLSVLDDPGFDHSEDSDLNKYVSFCESLLHSTLN